MSTTHIHSSKMRIIIGLTPLALNCVICAVFIAVRQPASSLIEDRERAEQTREIVVSSADPYMLIAERPLRQWNRWHGGEATWVKIAEVLNGPALIVTKRVGDRWIGEHAFSGTQMYRRESWQRAYIFAAASSVQWLIVGLLIARLVKPLRSGQGGIV
jgi:hypothetical protein